MKNKQSLQWIILLILLLFGGLYAYMHLQKPEYFPIEVVRIESGFTNLDKEQLTKEILPFTRVGFFALRVRELQQQLERLAWVAQVNISRVWPGTIVIKIKEQQAVFFWGNDGLINIKGEVFFPENMTVIRVSETLPTLRGPAGFATRVLQNYQNMSRMLDKCGLSIVELELSERLAWSLRLDNGIEVLIGRREPLKRVERFVTLYPIIATEKGKRIARVDLRYPQALAVRWEALT